MPSWRVWRIFALVWRRLFPRFSFLYGLFIKEIEALSPCSYTLQKHRCSYTLQKHRFSYTLQKHRCSYTLQKHRCSYTLLKHMCSYTLQKLRCSYTLLKHMCSYTLQKHRCSYTLQNWNSGVPIPYRNTCVLIPYRNSCVPIPYRNTGVPIPYRKFAWENSKLRGNNRPTSSCSHFNFSFSQTSTPVSIPVWKHGKCFLFLKYNVYHLYIIRTIFLNGWLKCFRRKDGQLEIDSPIIF